MDGNQYDDAIFRKQFPMFADETKYPEALASAYWDMASEFMKFENSPCAMISGKGAQLAMNYLTAHLMTLGLNASSEDPGASQGGFETSAAIDKISVSMLAPPADNMWKWWLAQSPFGQSLSALLYVKSVGGLSVGGLPERKGFRKVGGVFY
ncbi:virion structural protein [Xanthomonas phage XcP1]|uniref:DUF4054 domain-containing protein n=1 Tax=Xanthomonas phage XcP1 TaxID=2785027 RepID=A0A3S7L8I1_9CAUD|nr:virion structural protein [Xanthomonas phage XcP1]AWN08514.1 hypothetical protein XcP1_012 [Xanthomonas phage XcP1]